MRRCPLHRIAPVSAPGPIAKGMMLSGFWPRLREAGKADNLRAKTVKEKAGSGAIVWYVPRRTARRITSARDRKDGGDASIA